VFNSAERPVLLALASMLMYSGWQRTAATLHVSQSQVPYSTGLDFDPVDDQRAVPYSDTKSDIEGLLPRPQTKARQRQNAPPHLLRGVFTLDVRDRTRMSGIGLGRRWWKALFEIELPITPTWKLQPSVAEGKVSKTEKERVVESHPRQAHASPPHVAHHTTSMLRVPSSLPGQNQETGRMEQARFLACVRVGKLQQNNLFRPPTAVAETAATRNPHAQSPPSKRSTKDPDPWPPVSAFCHTWIIATPSVIFTLSHPQPPPPRAVSHRLSAHLPKPRGGGQYDLHEPAMPWAAKRDSGSLLPARLLQTSSGSHTRPSLH